jgi:hypothetical protein
MWGQDGSLWHPCLCIFRCWQFTFDRNSEFSLRKKKLKILIKLVENVNSDNSYSKPRYHVLSNGFSISKNTAAVDILLLKFKVTWSVSLIHWSVVVTGTETELACIKKAFFFNVLRTIFRMIFSNSLPVVEKRLIGRKFCGNFGSLPGFGNVITFAFFQGFGK